MRRSSFFAVVLAALLMLTGCGPLVEDAPKKTTLYATFYPIYALAELIVRDVPNVELHCLVQPQDGCVRDYVLSDWDTYLLAYSADIVIASGGGLESFETALEQFPLVRITTGMDLFQRDVAVEEENHFQGENPFAYMSLNSALLMAENIAEAMKVLDSANSERYAANFESVAEEMKSLRMEIEKQTEVCDGVSVAILNEALFYVAEDYNLDVSCVVERESGEALYSRELETCLEQINASEARMILIEQQAPKQLVDALEDAGYTVVKINIMSTLNASDGAEGFFEAYRANAQALEEACKHLQEERDSV